MTPGATTGDCVRLATAVAEGHANLPTGGPRMVRARPEAVVAEARRTCDGEAGRTDGRPTRRSSPRTTSTLRGRCSAILISPSPTLPTGSAYHLRRSIATCQLRGRRTGRSHCRTSFRANNLERNGYYIFLGRLNMLLIYPSTYCYYVNPKFFCCLIGCEAVPDFFKHFLSLVGAMPNGCAPATNSGFPSPPGS